MTVETAQSAELPITTITVETDELEYAPVLFVPPAGGSYAVTAIATDPNGRSSPPPLITQQHPVGLDIFPFEKAKRPFSHPQHNQQTAVLHPISQHPNHTQSVSTFYYSGGQTAVLTLN